MNWIYGLMWFWMGLGAGILVTSYVLLTARVMADQTIQVERPVMSPQEFLARSL